MVSSSVASISILIPWSLSQTLMANLNSRGGGVGNTSEEVTVGTAGEKPRILCSGISIMTLSLVLPTSLIWTTRQTDKQKQQKPLAVLSLPVLSPFSSKQWPLPVVSVTFNPLNPTFVYYSQRIALPLTWPFFLWQFFF